jgi:hypothetical protein
MQELVCIIILFGELSFTDCLANRDLTPLHSTWHLYQCTPYGEAPTLRRFANVTHTAVTAAPF